MAKYATTEELIECQHCHIKCADRELVLKMGSACCPNCGVMKQPYIGIIAMRTEGMAVVDFETCA